MICLEVTKRTDPRLLRVMKVHYSHPKGFVGRNICYAIMYEDRYYGHTVAGSATRFLPGRNDFLGVSIEQLNNVINNIFFHVEPIAGAYPRRNFVSYVVRAFREIAQRDWKEKYNDDVFGFETLIELPRVGICYKRDGWKLVGQTKGFTCKRVPGQGTDNWTGKRVWDTTNLRPKHVLCRKVP